MKVAFYTILSFFAIVGASSAAEVTHLRSNSPILEAIETVTSASAKKGKEKGGIGTQVIIHDAKQVPDENYKPILSKCFVDSYNGHDMAGFKMDSFESNHELDVPEGDDDESTLSATRRNRVTQYHWGWSNYWGCGRSCNADDNKWYYGNFPPVTFFESLAQPSAAELHRQFEEDLCACLNKSGLKTYHGVKECDVEYMYSFGASAVPFAK